MSPLILVDGSSFLYRAYYAAKKGFSTSTGLPTGAVLILTRMLQGLASKYEDCPFVVVFDAKGKSFRNEIYPDYKSNRPPMPDDLRVQLEYVQKMVNALGFPIISEPGVEADDVLGSYAKAAEAQGREVVICTGDKDLAQLVSDKVTMYDSMHDKLYDREGVKEKYGVYPELIVDSLALKGDSSDNIPGMNKVGDKTASELLNAMGGIAQVEANLDKVKFCKFRGAANFAKRFVEELDKVKLSYTLATIKTDVPLTLPIDELPLPKPDHAKLIELYRVLEFRRMLKDEVERIGADKALEILKHSEYAPLFKGNYLMGVAVALGDETDPSSASASATAADDSAADQTSDPVAASAAQEPAVTAAETDAASAADSAAAAKTEAPKFGTDEVLELESLSSRGVQCVLVDSKEKLDEVRREIEKSSECAFDTETDSLQAQSCHIVGMSLCPRPGLSYYIPLGHTYLTCPAQLSLDTVREVLGPVLMDKSIKKYGHNVKFDLLVLHFAAGMEVEGIYCDSMLLAHLLNSIQKVSLDDLSAEYLRYKTITFAEVTGGKRGVTFAQVPVEDACRYAAEDAEVTLRLCKCLLEHLKKEEPLQSKLFFETEMPFMQVLYRMECCGAYVSARELNLQNDKLNEMLAVCQRDIYTAAGQSFNIASTRQLGQVLFVDLQIPYPKKPKLGKGGVYSYSTAEDVLQEIAPMYDIANLVLRYRTLSKLISTYTEKLPLLIDKNSRIYTSFNQAGTVTGRLSSSDPNLQNIPARTEEGRHVRRAFCAPEGYVIMSADYSQIELRLIAHIAKEPNLIAAFRQGLDIHRATAAEVLGRPIEEITPSERSHAKATNFGLMYGMSAHGLSKQTGMNFKAAKAYVDRYFERYPRVKVYMEKVKAEAHEKGYVTTLTGRHISFAAIHSPDRRQAASAERAAINAPMQGSAADIIKEAMLRIDEWIRSLPEGTIRMTLQVHDELVFEVRKDFVEEAKAKVKELMENAAHLQVPLEVGIGVAGNWADAH